MSDVEQRNYYELLSVERGASEDEIRNSYKELARIFHPDSNFFADIIDDHVTEQADTFKLVTEAYQVLVSAKKRAEYDQTLPPVLKDWATSGIPAVDPPPTRPAAEAAPVFDKVAKSKVFGARHNTAEHQRAVSQVPSLFELFSERRTLRDRIRNLLGF